MLTRSIILSFVLIFSLSFAKAQSTLVVLKDSVKVKTDLISTSEDQLITKAGVFSLKEIFLVRFLSEEEAQKRPVVIEKLLKNGVSVYVGVRLLTPLPADIVKETPTVSQEKVGNGFKDDPNPLTLPDFGIGIGLDYGGIGARFTVPLEKHLGVFLGGGYAISGVGYNVGARIKFSPEKSFTMTSSIMYGYNAVIKIINASQYDKVYTGLSIGLGFESKSARNPRNAFQAGLILPFRSTEFDNDFASIKRNNNITISDPWPVLVTFGYHFSLK